MKLQLFRTEQRIKRLKDVLSKRQKTLTVVLENIIDPHNLSAALRSCDAVGIYEVCLIYDGSQPFPKLGAKSSASARKWIHIRKYKSIEECFTDLRKEKKKIYTTHMSKESVSLYDLKLTQPTALVFGNEHSGVSEETVNLADGNFLIPQVGMIQSLNISVAVAVSVYEAFRQRYEAGMYDKPQFKKTELNKMLEEWGKR